jgi:plasmid stability protein
MPNLSVRNVPDGVIERLRAQAAAEGVSVSEWIRRALTDRASLPTGAELAEVRRRNEKRAQGARDFDRYYQARLRRRAK